MKSRHARILEALAASGEATVQQLATRFGVSVMTIRRDLAVVVFPVDGPSGLHHFVRGSWVPCHSLAGAYVFTYFEKE